VTETTGAVIADTLLVLAKNSSALNTVTNDVKTLAARISGSAATFDYKDATTLDIGTAGTTDGITTNAGNIRVAALGTGALDVSQAIATTPSGAGAAGGSVILEAGGAIGARDRRGDHHDGQHHGCGWRGVHPPDRRGRGDSRDGGHHA